MKFKTELSLGGKLYKSLPFIIRDLSLFCFAVDTNSEGHGVEPSDDAGCGNHHPPTTDDVSKYTAISAIVAAAGIEETA